jgi:hypothetical protein
MFSYLTTRIPKMIRGMTIAFVGVSSCIGSIIYLQVERITTSSGKTYMTFGSIFLIDTITLVFLLICIFFNLYGMKEGGHGQEEEEVKETGYMDDK